MIFIRYFRAGLGSGYQQWGEPAPPLRTTSWRGRTHWYSFGKHRRLVIFCKSSKGKIGRILRIEGTLYFIYSKNPFSKEVAKQYKSKIEELQDVIGSNTKKEKIDLVPLSINLLIDVVPFIIIPLAILYLIAIFTDNTHWFDFLKSLLWVYLPNQKHSSFGQYPYRRGLLFL